MVAIDKVKEDALVLEYQRTKDELILNKIIQDRQETLSYLAWKYHTYYLNAVCGDVDDLKAELLIVLIKCINAFKPNLKNFGTLFLTSAKNKIFNMTIKINAKKKKNEGVLSLDRDYSDFNSNYTLKDVIPDKEEKIELQQDNIMEIAKCINKHRYFQNMKVKDIEDYLINAIEGESTLQNSREVYYKFQQLRQRYTSKQKSEFRKEIINLL